MKNIHYAGEVLMTGDALADAVVTYAETLAKNNTSAAIDIPVITDHGVATDANFLLGPASQIVAVPVTSDFDDPEDAELLATIAMECARLTGAPVVARDERDDSSLDFDF